MENTTDLTTTILNVLEQLSPGITKALNSHFNNNESVNSCIPNEEHNRELLQLDQNLADDINTIERNLENTIVQLNDKTNSFHILEEEIKTLNDKKISLTTKLNELKAEREEVHKDWIAVNHSQLKLKISDIFRKYFWDEYQAYNEDFRHTYWRFYGLITRKCYCVSMFGYDWTFDNIINEIEKYPDTKSIVDFLVSKHNVK